MPIMIDRITMFQKVTLCRLINWVALYAKFAITPYYKSRLLAIQTASKRKAKSGKWHRKRQSAQDALRISLVCKKSPEHTCEPHLCGTASHLKKDAKRTYPTNGRKKTTSRKLTFAPPETPENSRKIKALATCVKKISRAAAREQPEDQRCEKTK